MAKNPAYGQLDSGYQRQINNDQKQKAECQELFKTAGLKLGTIENYTQNTRIYIFQKTGMIVWIYKYGDTCQVSFGDQESASLGPVYLNKEIAGPFNGSRLVYKAENMRLVVYFKGCSSCQIRRRVVGGPYP